MSSTSSTRRTSRARAGARGYKTRPTRVAWGKRSIEAGSPKPPGARPRDSSEASASGRVRLGRSRALRLPASSGESMVAAVRVSEVKAEGVLRGACAALAAAAALLVGLSTETETVLLIRKKATVKDVQALWVLAMAAAAAAGYHLLQLLKCFYLGRVGGGGASPCRRSSRALAWTCLLLDKACAYTTFATTVAAAQACVIALDGAHALQWTKLCNIYTRFCEQIAGSLVLGLLAAVGTAVLSVASARNVFRHYSPSAGTYDAAAH